MFDKIKSLTWKGWALIAATTIAAFLQAAGIVDVVEWIPKLAGLLNDTPVQ